MRAEAYSKRMVMSNSRKARTRHLIQLGGLVAMSNLAGTIGLEGDLQSDPAQADRVAILMGGLLFLDSLLQSDRAEEARARFRESGRQFLSAAKSGDEEA